MLGFPAHLELPLPAKHGRLAIRHESESLVKWLGGCRARVLSEHEAHRIAGRAALNWFSPSGQSPAPRLSRRHPLDTPPSVACQSQPFACRDGRRVGRRLAAIRTRRHASRICSTHMLDAHIVASISSCYQPPTTNVALRARH